ncbi:DEAD/DEAH box helicase [Nocardia panacis]|uniref:DEAD/DEAH box helicase n=1 Tax=Nocardia panacis TaxID=2340916 RepID=A0A3A4KJM7_9NOCA|nr:DEAD/DEAH box helicase [Nocardia panacis]
MWSSRTGRSAPHPRCARDAHTRKAKNLSKITVEPEPGLTDTLLTAELDATHTAPTFAELGVRPEIVRALGEIGIERTFAIQELTLPLALAGEDLIGQARTGMGKTFGFGVPLLHRVATPESGVTPLDGTPRALVIVPTRELCIQVTQDLENAAKHLAGGRGPLRVTSIYGGRPYEAQIEALRAGVDVVVGTPGRLLDLADQQHLILGKVGVLVLDEADEMLDLGFLPDIERILNMVPEKRQTMLFSATMPGPIITLARTFLTRPTHIRAEEPHDSAVHDRTAQFVYRAHALDKSELIARILQAESRGATMIFTRTKRTAQKVADELAERGFAVGAVHGDLGQIAREKALAKFRRGAIDVLVATDVAARGIDIDDVTHVVNYQCPEDEKTYVHRIGRTGRAGRTGVAITLIDWDELNRWSAINAALGLGIPEPVETYSRSPHLFSDLGIPEGVTGLVRKPRPERAADAEVVERPARAARKRNRKRTRGGQPVEANGAALETDTEPTAENPDATPALADDEQDRPARRRRRRRRGGEENAVESESGATDSVDADAPTPEHDAAVSDAAAPRVTASDVAAFTAAAPESETSQDEQPAKPVRRRTRTTRAKVADTATATGDSTQSTEAPAADAGEQAAPRRTRRRRRPSEESAAGTAQAGEPIPTVATASA